VKYRTMKFCINKNSKGVTLLELLVAIAIFAVVITLVVTLFVTALKGQRKAIAMQNVQDNARFLLDFIVKELRMGTINNSNEQSYTLSIARPDPTDPALTLNVVYSFSGGNLQRTVDGTGGPINSDQVIATGMFYVSGKISNDNAQPKVTITLKVENKGTKIEEKATINVQATLSQRVLDL